MRHVRSLLVCSLIVLSAANANADGDDSLSPAARAELDAVMKDALAHARSGDYEAARLGYERAYERFPAAPVLFNLALAELRSGRALDALHHSTST